MDTRTCVVLAAHRCAAASLQHATFSPRSIGFPSSVRWASTTPFDVDFEVRNMADKVTIEQHACLRSSVELCVPPLLGVYPYGPQQPLLQQPCHDCARSLLQAIPIQSSSTSVAQYRGQLKEGATVSSHQDHSAISHMQSPLSIAQPTTGLNRSAHHWSQSLSPPLVSIAQPTTGLNRSAHHWSQSLSPPLVSIAQPTTGLSRSAHHWSQSLSPPLVSIAQPTTGPPSAPAVFPILSTVPRSTPCYHSTLAHLQSSLSIAQATGPLPVFAVHTTEPQSTPASIAVCRRSS
jgi:hypothetical protein